MKFAKLFGLLMGAVLLPACTPLIKYSDLEDLGLPAISSNTQVKQLVAIETPGAPDAMCTILTPEGQQTTKTPGNFTVQKGMAAVPVRCSKECFTEGGGMLASNVTAVTISMAPRPACRTKD
jgi:hypothetical protein